MKNTNINPAIFREYDIRGIAEKDLSADFALCLGYAYALFLTKNYKAKTAPFTVSVGRDCRLTGDAYATALISGMRKAGLNVLNLGVCPTPLTYFSVFKHNLDGGIMVTGSHNPADYNGFKICVGKDTLHGHQIQEMKTLVIEASQKDLKAMPMIGTLKDLPVIPDYVDYVASKTKPLKKMKIVLDAGNGTASTVAPLLFRKLGAEVVELFCELDGRFPNHHPDPTVVENLEALIATVKKEKADFGLAFDGDSDRIGMVDEKGTVIFGDEMMVLFSRDVLKDNPGATIISEVKSSFKLYDDITAKGGKAVMWKTGHSLIKSKMKELKASLAGEMSGHIFFADRYFGYDDAIYAGTRVYEIASAHKGVFSDLLSDLPKTVSTPEIRVDCEESKKFALVEETKKILTRSHKVNDIDGVRVEFGDGWGLVRASNTQPVLVVRYEATSEKRLNEIRTTVESAISQAAKTVGHAPIKT